MCRAALLLLLTLNMCQCAIFQIDSTYPFISVRGMAVEWHSGAAAQWALSSLLVRVHPRGVEFKKQGWHMRDLPSIGWTAVSCPPSVDGLCRVEASMSVFFPSSQSPEVSEEWSVRCSSDATGRVITNTSRYDASACDVLDRRMDFVYAKEVMHHADTSLPSWVYWSVCVLVIFLVRCLSRYILGTFTSPGTPKSSHDPNPRDKTPEPWVSLSASAVCTLLILSQGDSAYVTHEDLIFHWFTVLYILAYACLFVGVKTHNRMSRSALHDPPFYNLLAGVLQLVATRLYAGAETPYNPPLLFIVAVRALAKSRRTANLIRGVTLLLDACMLALMCTLGFGSDPFYLVALFAGAGVWADFLVVSV